MAIGIAFVACGSLALVTNSVVINETNKMMRVRPTSSTNGNISEPSQRIDVISLSSEGNIVFFSNRGNAYTNDEKRGLCKRYCSQYPMYVSDFP